jgi:hypothetical protein
MIHPMNTLGGSVFEWIIKFVGAPIGTQYILLTQLKSSIMNEETVECRKQQQLNSGM